MAIASDETSVGSNANRTMAVRFATMGDIASLVGYWRQFHDRSVFKHLALDEAKLAQTMSRIIEDKSGAFCFFVADAEDGGPVGVLTGQIDTYYFSNDPIAKMVFYWVHPEHRYSPAAAKLMYAFRQWAKNRGAAEIMVGVTSGEAVELADKMLKKMGFQFTGGNYSLVEKRGT